MLEPIRIATPAGIPAGVLVWHLPLDLEHDHPDDLRVLTQDEHARAARYRQPADRRRHVQARAALRRLLGRTLGIAAADVPLSAGPQGKPELAHGPAFNLSHAGDHAYLAVADTSAVSPATASLGIDIERCLPAGPLPPWLTLACDDDEADAIRRAPDPLSALMMHWTAKEAVLKALGTGIADHLQRVRISAGVGEALQLRTKLPDLQSIRACRLPAPHGYAAALAWRVADD